MQPEKVPTILVIDDVHMTVDMVIKALEKEYRVLTAGSAEEALKIVQEAQAIDLILLDIYLPQMDGFEFMEQLHQQGHGNIPVIVMTGEDEGSNELKALHLGAADFVHKPLYAEVLLTRIKNVLLRNKMEFDSLTGLYNRSKTFSDIRAMVKANPGKSFAFIRFDIDNFSIYNAYMGEEEGNRLLLAAAKVLRGMERDKECVFGRIESDVFCVCEVYEKERVEKRVQAAIKHLDDYRTDYRLQCSFGICVFDDQEVSIERIYTNASLAAHSCKGLYNKTYAYYEPWMSEKIVQAQEVINDMEKALQNREFEIYLQPKYDLESDEPCGAEALVRWKHPDKGMVSPGRFIPVFENNGFITKLDYYMWEGVCALLHRWQEEKRTLYPISVNISRVSTYNPQLTELLLGLLAKYDLPPRLLELEITESAYMSNPELMKNTVKQLQDEGFTILMDDFGSGYSSLNTLKEINVDILKVDMKFLPQGETAERSEKILSSVIRMASWLGIPTIAEGVETIEQRNYLKGIGCDYVQGYYYARPMPIGEYEELVGYKAIVAHKAVATQSASAVWSSDSKINEILTAIQLPVSIIEVSPTHVEIIRINSYYREVFGKRLRDYLSKEQIAELDGLLRRAGNEAEAEGEFCCENLSNKKRYFKIKAKLLEKNQAAKLLCAVLVDITAEKAYVEQLYKLNRLLPKTNRNRMLVIDDSAFARSIISSIFKDSYEICQASNGVDGLRLLEKYEESIAIILLDMVMPVMDGRAFLLEKNKLDEAKTIPVIVTSANDNDEDQLDMLGLGVNDYVTKPFEKRIFKQKVENAIAYEERFAMIRKEYEKALAEHINK